jgi:acyl-coenzyme A synthetase/AMP-(fatty) acid ligase
MNANRGWHTVHEGVLRNALTRPDRISLIEGERALTYTAMAEEVASRMASLAAVGVSNSNRVAVQMSNGSDQLIVILALSALGAIHLSLSSREAGDVNAAQVRKYAAVFLISDDPEVALPPCRTIFLHRLSRGVPTPIGPTARDPQQPWKIVQSSGSTGSPKAVLQTHAMVLAYASRLVPDFSSEDNVRFLQTIDMKYSYGLRLCLNVLAAGGTVVLSGEEASFVGLSELIDRHRITHIATTPFHGSSLAKIRATKDGRPPSLRYVSLAGSIATTAMQAAIREHLCSNLYIQYGANEVGYLTVADPELLSKFPSTIGRAVPGVEIEVIEQSGAPVGPLGLGLLRARGKNFPTSYIDNAPATAAAFRDGWYCPGDIVSIGHEGEIYYHGRVDNLVNFNGIKIAPIDIENALQQHPAVLDAVAFGLHHTLHQDIPCAVVTCSRQTSEDELYRFAVGLLGVRAPRVIAVLPEIPVAGPGKPDLALMRSMVLDRVRRSMMALPSKPARVSGSLVRTITVRLDT